MNPTVADRARGYQRGAPGDGIFPAGKPVHAAGGATRQTTGHREHRGRARRAQAELGHHAGERNCPPGGGGAGALAQQRCLGCRQSPVAGPPSIS